MLSERNALFLSIIIEEYLASGEPVASNSLVDKYGLNISSATMRNIMVELTQEGYLLQPHTSAGRIPTARAYRYFVDSYLQRKRLSYRVRQELESLLESPSQDLAWLELLVRGVAHMTSHIALAKYDDRFVISGWSNAIQHLSDYDQGSVCSLFSLLEDDSRLVELTSIAEHLQGVSFLIGDDIPYTDLSGCSIAFTRWQRGRQMAVLGVMGPMRMNYKRTLGMLRLINERMS